MFCALQKTTTTKKNNNNKQTKNETTYCNARADAHDGLFLFVFEIKSLMFRPNKTYWYLVFALSYIIFLVKAIVLSCFLKKKKKKQKRRV